MAVTAEQMEWTHRTLGLGGPPGEVGTLAGADQATIAVTSRGMTPDARLKSLYHQLDIQAPGHQLAPGDSCWSPKLALVGAWAGVIAAGAGTVALVIAPDPTTLTKWAAMATAAALLGALVALISAYGAVADCAQAADDAAERQREINELRQQQRKIQETVDQLRRQIEGR